MAQIKVITKNAPNSGFTEKYKDDAAIRTGINYIYDVEHGGEKTDGYRYIGGWAVDPANAAYEMELTARLYHKWSGVRLRHWVINFADADIQKARRKFPEWNHWQVLWKLAWEFTAYYANRYQLVFAVHGNRYPLHIHVVMNAVSYVDGMKYSGSKGDYHDYESYAKSVAARYGFPIFMVTDQEATKHFCFDD